MAKRETKFDQRDTIVPEAQQETVSQHDFDCACPLCEDPPESPEAKALREENEAVLEAAKNEPPPVAPKTFEQWARAKGHVVVLPKAGSPRGLFVKPGPDYRVLRQHTKWPSNQIVGEAEYDQAVRECYSLAIQ